MKVVAICGSVRKGNTEIMLKRALDGAKEAGAAIELILLKDKNIEFCEGANSDKEDDMHLIYGKVLASDALIFGSPNYFNNVSALMKVFMDRMDKYWDSEKFQGKKAGIICVGGQPLDAVQKCEDAIKEFCRICKLNVVGSVLASADAASEISENEKVLNECFELGKKLVSE